MRFLTPAAILLIAQLCELSALPAEQLKAHFEWGEYHQLIALLEPYFAAPPDSLDQKTVARFHCYLGVAYFGTGRAGDAQKEFYTALSYDSAVRPDRRYISEEIDNLFSVTLADYHEERERVRIEDSLRTEKQMAFDENLKALKQAELKKSRTSATLIALSLIASGAIFAGLGAYEYYSTREPYHEFRNAAQNGDLTTYNRLRPTIQQANGIIFGCALAAGISEVTGIVFSIRSFRLQ